MASEDSTISVSFAPSALREHGDIIFKTHDSQGIRETTIYDNGR